MKISRSICVVTTAALFATSVGHSQTADHIDAAQPSCARCTITLTKIATLGSVNDPDFAGTAHITTGLTVDSKGRFFATELGGSKILVYAPDGKFLQSFGTVGDGPGEFKRAMKISVDAGDSIYVLSQLRISMYTPQFKFVRSAAIPVEAVSSTAPLVLPRTQQLVFAGMKLFRGASFPFRTLSPKGEFGTLSTWRPSATYCSVCDRLVLSNSTEMNSFWSTYADAYEIQRVNTEGRTVQQLSVVNSSWFKSWPEGTALGGPTIKPNTTFMEMFQDRTGLLWVEGHGAIDEWTPPPRMQRVSNGGGRASSGIPIGGGIVPSAEVLKRHITYIDVLDPASKKLVFSQRFVGRQLRMLSAQLIAELREDADGIPVWDVYRVAIKRP